MSPGHTCVCSGRVGRACDKIFEYSHAVLARCKLQERPAEVICDPCHVEALRHPLSHVPKCFILPQGMADGGARSNGSLLPAGVSCPVASAVVALALTTVASTATCSIRGPRGICLATGHGVAAATKSVCQACGCEVCTCCPDNKGMHHNRATHPSHTWPSWIGCGVNGLPCCRKGPSFFSGVLLLWCATLCSWTCLSTPRFKSMCVRCTRQLCEWCRWKLSLEQKISS
jgi:hypothetical protein